MINDNDPDGPLRKITEVISMGRNYHDDTEPYIEVVYLECGHRLENTYGNRFQSRVPATSIKCRTCGLEQETQ